MGNCNYMKRLLFLLRLLKHRYYRKQILSMGLSKIKSDKSLFSADNLREFIKKNKSVSFYYFSGGTTGMPKTIPLSSKELRNKSIYRSECYIDIGVNKNNRVAILLPFGPWVAGPSAYAAVKQIKCTVFPLGLLKGEQEIISLLSIINKHNIDTLITTPSFLDVIFQYLNSKNNIKTVSKIITSGEFVSASLRKKVKDIIGAELYSTYASSETFVGHECSLHEGYHYNPNKVKINTCDGKIMVTVFDSEIVPIYNYEIGDLGYVLKEKCKCGLTKPRLFLSGREKNIFGLPGAVTVYPYQIIELIKQSNFLIKECLITISNLDEGRDFVDFSFGLEVETQDIVKSFMEKNIKNLSLDFADIYNQEIIEVAVSTFVSTYVGNKVKIEVIDKREYER